VVSFHLKTLRPFIFSAAFIVAGAANAATAPPETPDIKSDTTITVTGQLPDKEKLREAASTFVRSASVIPDEAQYARRNDPLCPAVVGIDQKYASLVSAKIKAVAEAVGVAVAPAGCRANLLVNFTADASAYLLGARKRQPTLLSALRPDERTALLTSNAPIRWWYGTNATGSDNVPIALGQVNGGVLIGTPEGLPVLPTPNRGTLRTYSPSLIDTKLVVNLSSTVVLIDIEKATGVPLDSVAAYAAMVSLAQLKLTTDYSSYPSILAMFSGAKSRDEAPRDLTEWDYAYLRALYKIQMNRTARSQRTGIYGEMVKQLTK
jgi:hypothetical protein